MFAIIFSVFMGMVHMGLYIFIPEAPDTFIIIGHIWVAAGMVISERR